MHRPWLVDSLATLLLAFVFIGVGVRWLHIEPVPLRPPPTAVVAPLVVWSAPGDPCASVAALDDHDTVVVQQTSDPLWAVTSAAASGWIRATTLTPSGQLTSAVVVWPDPAAAAACPHLLGAIERLRPFQVLDIHTTWTRVYVDQTGVVWIRTADLPIAPRP